MKNFHKKNSDSCVAGIISFGGVFYVHFSEAVQYHDKLEEFQLGLVKHGTEYQGSCRIAFQASPVSFLIVDLGMIV